jgi:hypothetical protein
MLQQQFVQAPIHTREQCIALRQRVNFRTLCRVGRDVSQSDVERGSQQASCIANRRLWLAMSCSCCAGLAMTTAVLPAKADGVAFSYGMQQVANDNCLVYEFTQQ